MIHTYYVPLPLSWLLGLRVIEHQWLGDNDWAVHGNVLYIGRTALTYLLFQMWMDRLERELYPGVVWT